MKLNYDKRTEKREFDVGDIVLLLLPTYKTSLQAKFEGPYEVMEKCGSDRYVISTPGRRKAARKVHANNMKLFHHRQSVMTIQGEVNSVQEEDNFIPTVPRINNSSILNNLDPVLQHLRSKEREDVKALLLRFPEILQDVPQHNNINNNNHNYNNISNNSKNNINNSNNNINNNHTFNISNNNKNNHTFNISNNNKNNHNNNNSNNNINNNNNSNNNINNNNNNNSNNNINNNNNSNNNINNNHTFNISNNSKNNHNNNIKNNINNNNNSHNNFNYNCNYNNNNKINNI
ncbi:hypothetical protein Pcinc_003331 [Petrolisthes cinctipes]|uniref:Uncharacterized protein n=1 Tax=Petrolisthes cinctipes TaxID=88211 RepID=A0AAE1L4S3_PETCI|nr:hypothetical protein Pcinc_003331 [Petrolisthes cinctipes]